jgi:putative peptidoglycan lipid II flippase
MTFNVGVVVPWAWLELPSPHAGLAAGTALGAFVNATLLYRGLRRDAVLAPAATRAKFLLRVAVAAGVMAVLLTEFVPPLPAWLEAPVLTRCLWLAVAVAGGGLAYFATLLAVGLRPADLHMTARRATV